MATVTLELPENVYEQLQDMADASHLSLDAFLAQITSPVEELTGEQIAEVEQGLADIQAGKVHSHADMQDLFQRFDA